MRELTRTEEFFSEGGVVVSDQSSALARIVAGLGLAAMVSFSPTKGFSEDNAAFAMAVDAGGSPKATVDKDNFAERILDQHVAEIAENMTVHQYGKYQVPHWIAKAIVRAAADTAFPADYLMAIAEKESGFDCDATPPKGSALGPFQYIEQSWLSVVKRHGAEFGMGDVASRIYQRVGKHGDMVFDMDDGDLKDEVLDMRRDPYLAAVMTASDLREARASIEAQLDIVMSDEKLYLPHFLGADKAAEVIAAVRTNPNGSATKILPQAARFNHAMFHGHGGRPLSIGQFVDRIESVITDRSGKYSDVAGEVARASFTPSTALYGDNDNGFIVRSVFSPGEQARQPAEMQTVALRY